MIVFSHFNSHLIPFRTSQMPLSPRQYHQDSSHAEKSAGHSRNGVSVAMALMVETMVHMVHNSQALQKVSR